MNIDSDNRELYKKLGLRVISDKEFHRLQDNISDFYRIHNKLNNKYKAEK